MLHIIQIQQNNKAGNSSVHHAKACDRNKQNTFKIDILIHSSLFYSLHIINYFSQTLNVID